LSHTVAFSEVRTVEGDDIRGSLHFGGGVLYMHSEVPNTPIQDIIRLCQNTPDAPCAPTDETWRGYHKLSARSAHPGGVNVMMLDTSVFLLSGLLGLLLWQIGLRSSNPFPKWIAISFAVTSLSEFVHAFVSVEWSGRFVSIVHVQQVLRPATWPPAAYLLPIGVGGALWLMRRGRQRTMGFGLALAVLTVALFAVFRWLPRYASTSWLGIARPSLIQDWPGVRQFISMTFLLLALIQMCGFCVI